MSLSLSLILRSASLLLFAALLVPLLHHYHCTDSGAVSPFDRSHYLLKGSLIPLLAIFWYLTSPVHSSEIYLATLATTIGDLFLISTDSRMVILGGAVFAISHICLMYHWWSDLRKISISAYGAMVPGIAVVAFCVVPPLGESTRVYLMFMFMFYTLWLESAACVAVARASAHEWQHASDWCAALGYFIFCVSDAILLGGELARGEGPRTREMYVVLTYAIAQLLLYFALATDPSSIPK
jgi:uncharacterized membrane protein YhhN